jgi:triosephosphate isomerase
MATEARVPIVGGNWKMHTSREEARALLLELRVALDGMSGVEVVICPPAPWLGDAADALSESSLHVGAQNVHWEASGACTGEQSASLLRGTAECVLVGHSERRHVFGETDSEVNRKLGAILEAGLTPILAVGETLQEREAGWTAVVLRTQLEGAFDGFERCPEGLVVAYEPVWAIGTGRTASPAVAQEACAQVRAMLGQRFSVADAAAVRIQYGGSVTAANSAELAAQPDIDGALVGGASLRAEDFAEICRAAARPRAG